MAKVVKNNLGYLGTEFQYRLIASFIDEPHFFKDLSSIIDQSMFTEPCLRTIVGVMKDFYQKNDIVPSYDMILIKSKEMVYSEDEAQYFEETIEKLRETTTEGVEEIEDMAERFFKQQNLIRVANEIKRIAGDGDMARYDECRKMVEDAMSVSRKTDDCVSPLEDINEVLSKESVVTIPTGVDKLDDVLGGGLDKGKLGIIIAGSGVGKTSMTTAFSFNAAINDYKVLQIVFEDSTRDIRRKYISRISQVESCDLNKDYETTERVKQAIKDFDKKAMLDNNIRIERLKVNSVTPDGIRNLVKRKINEGFKPDMLVVDYFGCIKLAKSNTQNKWEAEADAIREFENLAPELDLAIWLPVQGNRESFKSEEVTMDQVSGAIDKIQVAQVVISITKSREDQQNNRAKISVLKQRGGRTNSDLNTLSFNNGTCTITSDDSIDFDSDDDIFA